jgi:uncharacterized coiled-coil protein SlyX
LCCVVQGRIALFPLLGQPCGALPMMERVSVREDEEWSGDSNGSNDLANIFLEQGRQEMMQVDSAKEEQLQAFQEMAVALEHRLNIVECDYVAQKTFMLAMERVQDIEKIAGTVTDIIIRLERAEAYRASNMKRVTGVEDRMKVLAKTMDKVMSLHKVDEELLLQLDGRIRVAEDQTKSQHNQIELMESQIAEAQSRTNDSIILIEALAQENERNLDAVSKAADSMESTLHTRIDRLRVDELRKESNTQSKTLAELNGTVHAHYMTLDKLDRRVRRMQEAVKALTELEKLNNGDSGSGKPLFPD